MAYSQTASTELNTLINDLDLLEELKHCCSFEEVFDIFANRYPDISKDEVMQLLAYMYHDSQIMDDIDLESVCASGATAEEIKVKIVIKA